MSNRVVSEIYFSIVPEWMIESSLSDQAVRVYATLYRYADKDDGSCYPSIATIGKRCNKSVSSVKRAIKELKDFGAIEVRERYEKDKGQTSNLYILKMNPAFKNDPESPSKNDMGDDSNMTHKPKSFNQSHNYAIGSDSNLIFKTLTENLWDPKTKNERSGFFKVVKELREIQATPDQIKQRVNIYKTKWPDMTLTPYAISKNWTILGEMYEENKPAKVRDCNTEGHAFIDLDVIKQCRFCKIEVDV